MDDELNLAELNDVDLYILVFAVALLFPNASENRVFRKIAEEAQRRGWAEAPDEAVNH